MIRPNCLYRYPSGHGWCRHGIIRTTAHGESVVGHDTYWGGGEYGFYDASRLAMLDAQDELVFMCDLSEMRDVHEDEYNRYEETDRAWIPMGGGPARFLVNRNASESPALVREQMLTRAERLRYQIDRDSRELAALEATLGTL